MITIRFNDDDLSIRTDGHAGFAEKGRDIVCAAVSILLYTYQKMLEKLDVEADIGDDEEFFDIVPERPWDAGTEAETAYLMAKTGLMMIAENYKKNLLLLEAI